MRSVFEVFRILMDYGEVVQQLPLLPVVFLICQAVDNTSLLHCFLSQVLLM